MWIAKKQNGAVHLKAIVGIVNDAFTCRKANFIKILSTVNTCGIPITFYLEHIKSLKL